MGGSLYNSLYVSKLLLQASGIQQKIINIHSQNPIFIIIRSNDILGNDNLFEGIINFAKRSYFLGAFCLIRQGVGGLQSQDCIRNLLPQLFRIGKGTNCGRENIQQILQFSLIADVVSLINVTDINFIEKIHRRDFW